MPPTIQTNDRDNRPIRGGERKSELVCRVKYCNTLPDIPFDPKFIAYPFASNRFIQYKPTSLERQYKYEVLTEHDLGVTIDLINRDAYSSSDHAAFGAVLDPADEKLLEEDILTPQDSKRSRHHALSVSWLRRTEYISTEQTRFQPQTMDKVEAKVGYSIKKNLKDETLFLDRDSQIKAIEKTFQDTRKPIEKHYSKPNVVPVEVLPIYPDFKVWKYPCAQVIFDSDPAPVGRPVPAQMEEMSQAMIRGVVDESGEQFVAYFLPTEETLTKRRRDAEAGEEYVDGEEYEYKMAREYNWNVKSKASKGYEENYFLVVHPDGAYYNELETRVRLSKRRQKAGQPPNNTRLVVRHRPLTAQEYRMQRYREKQLEPPGEEEEEEEEEEEGEEEEEEEDEEKEKEGEEEEGAVEEEEEATADGRMGGGGENHKGEDGDAVGEESEDEGEDKARQQDGEERGGEGGEESGGSERGGEEGDGEEEVGEVQRGSEDEQSQRSSSPASSGEEGGREGAGEEGGADSGESGEEESDNNEED